MGDKLHAKLGKASDKDIWIACHVCAKVTCHRAFTIVETSDESPDGSITVWVDYSTVQCQGCREVSFLQETRSTEDLDQDEAGRLIQTVTTRQYPGRIAGRPAMEGYYYLPQGVYQVYNETHAALCGHLPILAGIGIRAIVEAVCKERAAPGVKLHEQIDGLVGLGFITVDAAKILHNLRFMGNKAAHETKAHTQEELGAAFDVAEHLLRGVYVIPKLAAKLPPP